MGHKVYSLRGIHFHIICFKLEELQNNSKQRNINVLCFLLLMGQKVFLFRSFSNQTPFSPLICVLGTLFFVTFMEKICLFEDYVGKLFSGSTSSDEQRRTGFKWTHGLCSRIRYIFWCNFKKKITESYFSRRIFSVLLRRANAIKVWANAIKMTDPHKYE